MWKIVFSVHITMITVREWKMREQYVYAVKIGHTETTYAYHRRISDPFYQQGNAVGGVEISLRPSKDFSSGKNWRLFIRYASKWPFLWPSNGVTRFSAFRTYPTTRIIPLLWRRKWTLCIQLFLVHCQFSTTRVDGEGEGEWEGEFSCWPQLALFNW